MRMIALSNRAWLVAALVLSALLLAAVPRAAEAHDHPPPTKSGTALEADAVAHGWSHSCPASPGGMCCCAGVFALAGAGKPMPANSQAWSLAVAPAAGAAKFATASVPPIAARPLHQARPRAPPLST